MTLLEIVAVIFTLICVALTVVRSIWCWPMGIIAVSTYFLLFYQEKLYADMGLQVFFFAQSVYGWYWWVFGKKDKEDSEVPIKRLTQKEQWLVVSIMLVMVLSIGSLLRSFTDADVPYWDATVASMSLVANMLLARKVLENWYIWIFVDFLYVGLFFYKELYLSAGLYFVFLFMATAGLLKWKKDWSASTVLS